MEIDDAIAELAVKLDGWLETNIPVFESGDRAAQVSAIHSGIALATELDELKRRGLTALRTLVESRSSTTPNQRAASLLAGFRFGARLADTLHDELLDTMGKTEVVRSMRTIVTALDEIDPGRAALVTLLSDPDAGVRAFAGAYLIKLMPERVVPILRDIEEQQQANSAHFSASWTLLRWEREGTQRSGGAPK